MQRTSNQMASHFRLNRYNWFGHKLLAQHKYEDIIGLHSYHINRRVKTGGSYEGRLPLSEYLVYLQGLALMRSSSSGDSLNKIILALQGLNFDRNPKYLLLLAQTLLYSGNHDSVVAICKQIISKEIKNSSISHSTLVIDNDEQQAGYNVEETTSRSEIFDSFMSNETAFDFKKAYECIAKDSIINEPKLWLIFGQCLEFQRQFKDAHFVYRVASCLALGSTSLEDLKLDLATPKVQVNPISRYLEPQVKFAKFSAEYIGDNRSAILTLIRTSQLFHQNYSINSFLALLLTTSHGSRTNFNKAIEIISALEAYSNSTRNPSESYNKLTSEFRRKWFKLEHNTKDLSSNLHFEQEVDTNENQKISYLLIKSHIIINSLCLNSCGNEESCYKTGGLMNQIDKVVHSLKRSNSTCWSSASLWNNLGVCYLMKKRLIVSFSCLFKAYQLDPLDWRINYNLAVVCLQIGLSSRALIFALAAKNYYCSHVKSNSSMRVKYSYIDRDTDTNPLITTILASCYDNLNLMDDARRLYIDSIRTSQEGQAGRISVIALVNYLVFLHKNISSEDEQQVKLKLHLLDQLEQSWLTRDQSDPLFSTQLLNLATQISEEIFDKGEKYKLNRKTYAWSKFEPFEVIQ